MSRVEGDKRRGRRRLKMADDFKEWAWDSRQQWRTVEHRITIIKDREQVCVRQNN